MASAAIRCVFRTFSAASILLFFLVQFLGVTLMTGIIADGIKFYSRELIGVGIGATACQVIRWWFLRWWRVSRKDSVYSMQHGKLHLQVPTDMWMNMVLTPQYELTLADFCQGYWKGSSSSTTLSEACRDLLGAVLAEAASFSEPDTRSKGVQESSKCLIDVGIGCGDQTLLLAKASAVRKTDIDWWERQTHNLRFHNYVGITNNSSQARFASERFKNLLAHDEISIETVKEGKKPMLAVFCADAAVPAAWADSLQIRVRQAVQQTEERWLLALDTAYHFSPSRWVLIKHAFTCFDASFMAFDLCLSPSATTAQILLLRVLCAIMGAPWANFVTPQEYHNQLMQAGYNGSCIAITDISEHVFTPLAEFLDRQNQQLATMGMGIGSFNIAKAMFAWWGRSGVVRGVIVVAKKQ